MLQALAAIMVVFAITLLVTKSKIFACKREFVQKRYESAKVGDQRPGYIHTWWAAMWIVFPAES